MPWKAQGPALGRYICARAYAPIIDRRPFTTVLDEMRCNDHCLSMAVSFTLSVGKSVCLIAIVAWSIVAILWMVEIAGVRELDCRNTSANKEVSVIKSPGPANKTEKMLKYYLSQIRNRTKFSKQENCTVVIVAHNGFPVLFNLLLHYCRKITWIDSVVVIWNNLNATIPASLTSLNRTCEANLKFIQSSKDRYTNRYLPRKEIETDCKFFFSDRVAKFFISHHSLMIITSNPSSPPQKFLLNMSLLQTWDHTLTKFWS